MKKFTFAAIAFTLILSAANVAWARDIPHMMPIEAAMQAPDAKEKLGNSVKFFFGHQPAGIKSTLGSSVSNRKTNAFGKSDASACNWAFLSAMLALKERAEELGANAVVNIESYYKKRPMSSTSKFECHTGAVMAGVALKGEFVKM